jgi:hypothetical protein
MVRSPPSNAVNGPSTTLRYVMDGPSTTLRPLTGDPSGSREGALAKKPGNQGGRAARIRSRDTPGTANLKTDKTYTMENLHQEKFLRDHEPDLNGLRQLPAGSPLLTEGRLANFPFSGAGPGPGETASRHDPEDFIPGEENSSYRYIKSSSGKKFPPKFGAYRIFFALRSIG